MTSVSISKNRILKQVLETDGHELLQMIRVNDVELRDWRVGNRGLIYTFDNVDRLELAYTVVEKQMRVHRISRIEGVLEDDSDIWFAMNSDEFVGVLERHPLRRQKLSSEKFDALIEQKGLLKAAISIAEDLGVSIDSDKFWISAFLRKTKMEQRIPLDKLIL